MRRRFQFVNRCLRDVFPKQQLCQIVCEPPHVREEHVYGGWICLCKIFDNPDTHTGIPDFRGNSKHDSREFVFQYKTSDNLNTCSGISDFRDNSKHGLRVPVLKCKIFDNPDTHTGILDFRGNSKHDSREFVCQCKILDNLDTCS